LSRISSRVSGRVVTDVTRICSITFSVRLEGDTSSTGPPAETILRLLSA